MRLAALFLFLGMPLSSVVHATDIGSHAKVGALLADECETPNQAFIAGFASHIALDYLVYGTTLYDAGDSVNSDYLLPSVALNVLQLHQVYKQYKKTKDKKLLYGTLGGMFPDVVDLVYHELLDNEGYVFAWHKRKSTLLVSEPPGLSASRKAANYNLLIGVLLWSHKF